MLSLSKAVVKLGMCLPLLCQCCVDVILCHGNTAAETDGAARDFTIPILLTVPL
jgi:hypothetical protein